MSQHLAPVEHLFSLRFFLPLAKKGPFLTLFSQYKVQLHNRRDTSIQWARDTIGDDSLFNQTKQPPPWKILNTNKKTSRESQHAAQRTSHQLSRCNKFITIWVLETQKLELYWNSTQFDYFEFFGEFFFVIFFLCKASFLVSTVPSVITHYGD